MFRDELMALNAIYEEQKKTNELLEKLIPPVENKVKEVAPDAPKGSSGGDSGEVTKLSDSTVNRKKNNTSKRSAT